jgi:hypothetical protein
MADAVSRAIIRQKNKKTKARGEVQTGPTPKYRTPEQRAADAAAKAKPSAGEEEIAGKIFGGGLHPKYGMLKPGVYTLKKKKK